MSARPAREWVDSSFADAVATNVDRLEADGLLRLELAICDEYKIPHSTFLEWDVADRAKTIAYRRWKSQQCPRCGSRDEDWIDDEGRLLEIPALRVTAHKCFGCAEIEGARDDVPAEERSGVTFRLASNPKDDA